MEINSHRAALFDVTPRQLERIAGKQLPEGYRRKLRGYRYGPGVFKMDFALDGPIPWQAKECARASTVHLGGTLDEIAAAERAVWKGEHLESVVASCQPACVSPSALGPRAGVPPAALLPMTGSPSNFAGLRPEPGRSP